MTDIPGTVQPGTIEATVASADQTIRAVRRSLGTGVFLASSLTILLPALGLGQQHRLDGVPPWLRYGIIGMFLATEAFLLVLCGLASRRAPTSFLAAMRDRQPFTPAGDADPDSLLMRYYQAYGFKAVLQFLCLLGLQFLASLLYSITDTHWSMANLVLIVVVVVVVLPTRGRMERWALTRAQRDLGRTIDPR